VIFNCEATLANAELKTKKTTASVSDFIDAIEDDKRRADCRKVLKIMKAATKSEPRMWGEHLVGFGDWHYKYASGREADWFVTGFASRKAALTLYFMTGLEPYKALLAKLGKHSTGKGCLHIKNLDDIDMSVLTELINNSARDLFKPKAK
jgi:hypothetical protein